jgi:short-subunit dehydrogenase
MALPPPSSESTAVITGASSGLGEQFARQLAERGYGVTLVARSKDKLDALATELAGKHGIRAEVVAADLSDPGARDNVVREVAARGLVVDILVNTAGFGVYAPFAESDRARELEQVRVLVEAVVDLTSHWLPGMVERKRGAVINVSSTSALQPLPYNSTYAAAKAYVQLFTEGLWEEVRRDGVTVTAVLPGPVRTGFQEASDAAFADKLPGVVWIPPEKVVADSIRAADKGKRSIIPGAAVKAAFAPNRFAPKRLALMVGGRIMSR